MRPAVKCGRCGTAAHGPGPFEGETRLAEDIDEMGFFEEELGDVEHFGWYGKISASGKLVGKTHEGKRVYDRVKGHRHPVYAILRKDSNGFNYLTEYPTEAALDDAWTKLEAEEREFDEEGVRELIRDHERKGETADEMFEEVVQDVDVYNLGSDRDDVARLIKEVTGHSPHE